MRRSSPYQGLVPYTEDDYDYFFGRDGERENIADNLSAYRLTVLYGASGVGKTSVLRAGVMHDLKGQAKRRYEEDGSPEFVPLVFNSWSGNPTASLKERVKQSVGKFMGSAEMLPPKPERGFARAFEEWTVHLDADLLIVLDQFEDFFFYHPEIDASNPFAADLIALMQSPKARVHFLISIRDDALALLDRFQGHIPAIFDNYLRVRPLGREAGAETIKRPLEEFNRQSSGVSAFSIDEELISQVLDGVELDQDRDVPVLPYGLGTDSSDECGIDAAYLQLVMSRLWEEETRSGSHELRSNTLQMLGGARQIVEQHVGSVIGALEPKQQELVAAAFRFLVTPSGKKVAHSVSDLAEYTHSEVGQLQEVLEALCRSDTRILIPVGGRTDSQRHARYEIRHDRLGPAILTWRRHREEEERRREGERRLGEERRKRHRTRTIALVVGSLLSAALVVALFLASHWRDQRDQAQHQLSRSQARAAQLRKFQVAALAAAPATWAVKAERIPAPHGSYFHFSFTKGNKQVFDDVRPKVPGRTLPERMQEAESKLMKEFPGYKRVRSPVFEGTYGVLEWEFGSSQGPERRVDFLFDAGGYSHSVHARARGESGGLGFRAARRRALDVVHAVQAAAG